MSASILYRPLADQRKCVDDVLAPSRFLGVMGKCFGNLPFTLGEGAIPTLSGMAATWDDDMHNPFERIIELIEKYGTIEVWAEY